MIKSNLFLASVSALVLISSPSFLNKRSVINHPYGIEDAVIDYVDVNDGEPDPVIPFDDSIKYTYENLTFSNVNGGMTENSGVYTSNASNSMAIANDSVFPYGTISVNVKSFNTCDTGIVFGVDNSAPSKFWESGVSYYFFFLGQGGNIFLGKVNQGRWESLVVLSSGSTVDSSLTYNLKVVYKSNKISCYFNNELKYSFRDPKYLSGSKFGLRAGASGCTFSNLSVTSEYLYE